MVEISAIRVLFGFEGQLECFQKKCQVRLSPEERDLNSSPASSCSGIKKLWLESTLNNGDKVQHEECRASLHTTGYITAKLWKSSYSSSKFRVEEMKILASLL